MPVPAANIVFVVLAHIGGPLLIIPSPNQPQIEPQTQVTGLTISIADSHREVSGGQKVKYRITVTNPTESEAPVTIRLTLPASAVKAIEAEDATIVANAVAWKNKIPAGQSQTYSLVGTVDTGVAVPALEATACVHVGANNEAVTCASDRNEVSTPARSAGLTWLAAILFGILAVIGAIWLQRKIQPEPLTPASAAASQSPELPGGAPSA